MLDEVLGNYLDCVTDPMAEWRRMQEQATQTPSTTVIEDLQPARSSASSGVIVLLASVMIVLVTAGVGVFFLTGWVGERQGPDGPGRSGADPAAQPVAALVSTTGFRRLVDALEEETGSTSVVDLTLYPTYAVAVVPEPGGKGRTRSYYYDGTLRETGLGTTTDQPLDLKTVDVKVLVRLAQKARKAVQDPTSWYLILGAPDTQGAVIYAYASNEYGEGGYVAADLAGKVVNRVGW